MPARRSPPSPPIHVVLRAVAGAHCFAHTANYWHFLADLRRARRAQRVAIHAYALLPDRVELLVSARADGAATRMLQALGARYVRYFNASSGRQGRLWRSEPARAIAGNAALLRCQRALELEPVRAGLVAAPGHYRWSSYRHNALGDHDPLVAPHPHYLKLARSEAGRRQRWQALVADAGEQRT